MTKKINRRTFLQSSAALATATISGQGYAQSTSGESPVIGGKFSSPAPIPAKKGPRVVIVGGGWSGLTMAKYLKKTNPKFDVVLLDKNQQFVSCPISNVWMADQVNLDFLTHSYVEAAQNNDYLFLNATALELDRTSKILVTTLGSIKYDYLVVAPGIDYDYNRIGVDNPEDEYALRMNYPAGFSSASEIMAIKHKLHNFKGGTLVLTVPSGNYRCIAAPYERACMAAAIFKKHNIRGKILLLDMNSDIRIKAEGFKKAFAEYYGNIIQYEPSAEINGVRVVDKVACRKKRLLTLSNITWLMMSRCMLPEILARNLFQKVVTLLILKRVTSLKLSVRMLMENKLNGVAHKPCVSPGLE